jgi:hypothetical protein
VTSTLTLTSTPSFTRTGTSTYTATPTTTPTFTATLSPTITQTSFSFPYTIRIRVYNSAGEVVQTIAEDTTSNVLTGLVICANGVTNPATVSGDMPLEIILPGIHTPGSQGSGQSAVFTWKATNAQSQNAVQGIYYIKVEQSDAYGHTSSFITDVTIVNAEEYIELNIFNSSGEIVRSIHKTGPVPDDKINLEIDDVITISADGSPVNIKYGTAISEYIQWDGRNQTGGIVSNGSYEMQIIIRTMSGTVMSSQTVIVLRQEKNYIETFAILPNPYNAATGNDYVTFKWTVSSAAETGSVYIRIYDISGGLVKILKGKLEDTAGINWDLRVNSYEHAGVGIYICVLETRNSAGFMNRKVEKMAITGYEESY